MKGEAPPLCACGCGERVTWNAQRRCWNTYIRFHRNTGRKRSEASRANMKAAALRRWGNPVVRFWSSVDKSERPKSCWIWKAGKDKYGYGIFCCGGDNYRAHRVAYQLTQGEIPKGKCVLHHCDNPSCVNPSHLFVGTHADNVRDKVAKGRQARGDTLRSNRIFLKGGAVGTSKLNEEQVKEIRSLAAMGLHRKKIAEKFNVHKDTIRDIIRRKIWKHI